MTTLGELSINYRRSEKKAGQSHAQTRLADCQAVRELFFWPEDEGRRASLEGVVRDLRLMALAGQVIKVAKGTRPALPATSGGRPETYSDERVLVTLLVMLVSVDRNGS